jgi:hypothetical protein
MIDKAQINNLIEQIPAIPSLLKVCEKELLTGNLTKAAKVISDDLAFVSYMQTLINSPAYGLKSEIKDINQIFTLLGANGVLSVLNSYTVLLNTPKKWQIFNIDNYDFANLQAGFLSNWSKILNELKIDDKEILRSIALVPATIFICDRLFSSHTNILDLVIRMSGLSYNEILKREAKTNIFEIVAMIAKKWDFSNKVIEIFNRLDSGDNQISTYMKLLISYELSLANYSQAGFGELFDFAILPNADQMQTFLKAISYEG